MPALKKLLEPGRIGSLELKNRLLYSAMDLRSTDGRGHISGEAAASFTKLIRLASYTGKLMLLLLSPFP